MQTQILPLVWSLTAALAGVVIGLSFGKLQTLASRRHQRLVQSGKLENVWAVMPGSMRRVGYLLVALAIVQVVCPLLFTNGYQWWVSGGVLAGYGAMLFLQLRQRLSETH
ncbi:MAG TPA: hypothetical protein VL361_24435 [Candidatus Limnocylindrales bacterium]|jgi:hypothetical protein|nr:hypothetical protein [Candidatus Limnocylindrales bacterium]